MRRPGAVAAWARHGRAHEWGLAGRFRVAGAPAGAGNAGAAVGSGRHCPSQHGHPAGHVLQPPVGLEPVQFPAGQPRQAGAGARGVFRDQCPELGEFLFAEIPPAVAFLLVPQSSGLFARSQSSGLGMWIWNWSLGCDVMVNIWLTRINNQIINVLQMRVFGSEEIYFA